MIRRLTAAGVLLVVLAALGVAMFRLRRPASVTVAPRTTAALAPGTPVFDPEPATAMALETSPLGISPDGFARWLVRVRFTSARGAPTRLVRGGDIAFVPTHGSAQWQTRVRFGSPAAIVSTTVAGPLGIAVRASAPLTLAPRRAVTDTRAWLAPRVVAAAVGPHVVQLGWFPVATAPVRIARVEPDGTTRRAFIPPPSSTYRDGTVVPGATERYAVTIGTRGRTVISVRVPPEPAHASLAQLGGKAMWLSFSPAASDPDGYDRLQPAALVARAGRAGIRVVELRTAYGPLCEITRAARPIVDAFIDAAAASGIVLVAWTVPRGTDFDDLQATVAATRYRTGRGNGFGALAVDLERGDDFLGAGRSGYAAIATYVRRLRAALGPAYPLVATVEDPYLGHLTNAEYPYAAVAAEVDALQPMTYWRMMSARAVTPEAVGKIVRASYATTRDRAGRPIPVDMGGQTAGEGPRGAPPADEIVAAVRAARAAGALGVTFFDWTGTTAAQWAALERAPWPAAP